MNLRLTITQLKEHNACPEGIEAFRRIFGEEGILEWTPKNQIELFRGPLGQYIVWAWKNKLIPRWSMSGADLSKADLSGANLSRADLYGADLSGANLSRADLSRADLSRADLSGADLSGANLYGANLYGANFYGSCLSRADLSGADLSGADLSTIQHLATFGWIVKDNIIIKQGTN